MFQGRDTALSFAGGGGGLSSLPLDRALPRAANFGRAVVPATRLPPFYVLPDLGVDIGSRNWWRGLAACVGLCAVTIALAPGLDPIVVPASAPLSPAAWEAARAQAIAPLAWGADSGQRMAPTDAVQPLSQSPERPRLDLVATIGQGDSLGHALSRAGVSDRDAAEVSRLVSEIVAPDAVADGTALAIGLGRRARSTDPRPLEALAFRARFDMRVQFERVGPNLAMTRVPIAVDETPLRIVGTVGDSLYTSARAGGAPPKAVESYIRALAPKVPMDDLSPGDRFTMVVEQARAATGEVRFGKLLYVGLARGERATRMIQWTIDGRTAWFDAAGVGQSRGGYSQPVAGARRTSGFGMRVHPILGYSRMHQGVDYAAPHGTPIRAVSDGVVAYAGWHGGHGKMVKLTHAGGIGTGYAHMSGITVAPGSRVAQGQVIGYVGSTGMSTGPHLHFEVYRGGAAVNPAGVSFQSTPLLQGAELAAFRSRLQTLAGS